MIRWGQPALKSPRVNGGFFVAGNFLNKVDEMKKKEGLDPLVKELLGDELIVQKL